jgi:DNA-binding transcriptional LysR family regulator
MFDIEIRDLRILFALASNGSLVRAARVLKMSQPGLTRALTAIETKVGSRLFDRSHRGLDTTEACRAILASGSNILAEVNLLRATVSGLGETEKGTLAVAAGPFAQETVVLPAVAHLIEAHPNIQMHARCFPAPSAVRELRERRAELLIVELTDVDAPQEFEIIPLRRHPIVLMVRHDHPLTMMKAPLKLEDIFAYPTVTSSYVTARVAVPIGRARSNATGFEVHPMFPAALVESVSDCLGIAAVSSAITGATAPSIVMPIRSGALVALPFHAPWLTTNFGILSLRGVALSPAAQSFIRLIKEADQKAAALAMVLVPHLAAHVTPELSSKG